jgi:hypothetical protein
VKGGCTVKEPDVIERLPGALESCFQNVPRSSIVSIERGVRLANDMMADLVVAIKALGRSRTLIVEVKSSGQPLRTREAVNQLKRMTVGSGLGDAYPVFAAPYISDASAHICREQEVGYLDLAGNCRFAFDNVYIERVAPDNKYKEQRGHASLFTPKSSRIIRLMLGGSGAWQVQQLAAVARVSIGLVSKVKQELQEREWLVSTEEGIKLSDPEQVLKAWAQAYSYKKSDVREYYTMAGGGDSEAAAAHWCEENGARYALTGFSAARLSSPRVRYTRSSVYVESRIEDLARGTDLKPVDSGGNVLLLKPYDEGVFQGARILYGMEVVSPAQLYLDLQSMPGRGEEAAEEVLVRELRPSW